MKTRMAVASVETPGIGWRKSRDQARQSTETHEGNFGAYERDVTAFLISHVARLLILSGVPRGSGSLGRNRTLITLVIYIKSQAMFILYIFS